jgi:hypothetical protein
VQYGRGGFMYIKMRCMILCTLSSLPTVFSFFMGFTWNAVGVILEKIFVVGSSGKKKEEILPCQIRYTDVFV